MDKEEEDEREAGGYPSSWLKTSLRMCLSQHGAAFPAQDLRPLFGGAPREQACGPDRDASTFLEELVWRGGDAVADARPCKGGPQLGRFIGFGLEFERQRSGA
jgi:hypothetical protein